MMVTDKFLTVKETAEFLREHPVTTRGRFARGQIPGAMRIGRQWLVSWGELQAHMAALAKPAAPSTPTTA